MFRIKINSKIYISILLAAELLSDRKRIKHLVIKHKYCITI